MKTRSPRWLCLALSATFIGGAAQTFAAQQPTTAPAPDASDRDAQAQYLEDFIHYVLIARPELAAASLQQLFNSGVSDAGLYVLIDEYDLNQRGRLDDALIRAAALPEIEDIAGELSVRIRQGRIDMARDPAEIERHIQNLTGSQRAKLLARQALISAGEYAVPQLLDALDGPDFVLKREVEDVLVSIGREAVTPLTVALPHLVATTQERVARILGLIDYPHALPALYELANSPEAQPAIRDAANRAYAQIGGLSNTSVAELWLALAEQYWVEARSLIPNPTEPRNNVWSYNRGLIATAVPTDIYSEIMVMRTTEKALRQDTSSDAALSLWIAANFRRDDQIGDLTDPLKLANARSPVFYAVASGPQISQMILARANSDLNSRLARHSIDALQRTAGGATLWTTDRGISPLVEALHFPERRVRFDAALALGKALPLDAFPESDRVVPALASAIRTGAETFAAVIADDAESRSSLAANLRSMGFTVIPPRASYGAMQTDLAGAVGIDIFVVMDSPAAVLDTVAQIRNSRHLGATPVLALVDSSEAADLEDTLEDFSAVRVTRTGVNEEQMASAIMSLIESTTGELMSTDEADLYAAEALRTLRDIAVRNTPAYNVHDAESALLDALDNFEGELRLIAAETLSWLSTPQSQRALLDASIRETDEFTQAALLGYVSDSAKRWGSFAQDRQVHRLLDLVANGSGVTATAAAQAHGALNLPVSNVTPFILDEPSRTTPERASRAGRD